MFRGTEKTTKIPLRTFGFQAGICEEHLSNKGQKVLLKYACSHTGSLQSTEHKFKMQLVLVGFMTDKGTGLPRT